MQRGDTTIKLEMQDTPGWLPFFFVAGGCADNDTIAVGVSHDRQVAAFIYTTDLPVKASFTGHIADNGSMPDSG